MGEYYAAVICRRGHVETTVLGGSLPSELTPRCTKCGAANLRACPECGNRIRGSMVGVAGGYRKPDFCDHCGAPYPWLSRQGRIFLLQNMLDEEELDPADRLEVEEQLKALMEPDLSDEEQAQRWEKVKRLAPAMWEKSGAQKILETVVSAAIKGQLDL